VVVVNDESVSMMSGGGVDVELSLLSRNTLGNEEPQLKFLKTQSQMLVVESGGMVGYVEGLSGSGVVVVEMGMRWQSGSVEKLQKCSFGCGSRMIRAGLNDPGLGPDRPRRSTVHG